MASLLILYSFIFLMLFTTISGKFSDQFPLPTSTKRMEKMTHLHFYYHDTSTGTNPTAMRIAGPLHGFGRTTMVDDPLTEGPEPTSKLVGRAQGLCSLASESDFSLLMVMNFVFKEGMYNGSRLSVLGRTSGSDKAWEMPIVGGTGIFRFARGYVFGKSSFMSEEKVVTEFNASVVHF